MTFRRSNEGLSNLRLFAGVDLIVFTEGGPRTIAKTDAIAGDYEAASDDIVFWKSLFDAVRPNKTVSYRSLGSKTTLVDIARDVKGGSINGVCVTIDRDYDAHFFPLIESTNVIYSRGYSWENDLFHEGIVVNVFYNITRANRGTIQVTADTRRLMRAAVSHLRWLIYADILLCVAGTSLFNRKAPQSAVGVAQDGPFIKRTLLLSQFHAKRKDIGKLGIIGGRLSLDVRRDCYGKILLEFLCQILFYLIKSHTNLPKIAKHYLLGFFISELSQWVLNKRSSYLSRYYFSKILAVRI